MGNAVQSRATLARVTLAARPRRRRGGRALYFRPVCPRLPFARPLDRADPFRAVSADAEAQVASLAASIARLRRSRPESLSSGLAT